FSSNQLNSLGAQNQTRIKQHERQIQQIHDRIDREHREPNLIEAGQLDHLNRQANQARADDATFGPWRRAVRPGGLGVPKTGDIQKILSNLAEAPVLNDLFRIMTGNNQFRPQGFDEGQWQDLQEQGTAGQRAMRDINIWESLGTSMAVTIVTLGLAVFI